MTSRSFEVTLDEMLVPGELDTAFPVSGLTIAIRDRRLRDGIDPNEHERASGFFDEVGVRIWRLCSDQSLQDQAGKPKLPAWELARKTSTEAHAGMLSSMDGQESLANTVLVLLAALVPTSAGFWAAGASLVRNRRDKRRLSDAEGAASTFLEAERMEAHTGSVPGMARSAYEDELEQLGLNDGKSRVEIEARGQVASLPLTDAQARDQWILLSASALGVVLLAVSGLF